MSLPGWFDRRRRIEDDFQAEIDSHLALAAQDRVADGADRDAARAAAKKEFGNVTLTTEAVRRVWSPWWMEALIDLWQDVRYAVRLAAKSPGFSLTVIAVLALGISLNTAVFTMFKGLALEPLAGVPSSGFFDVIMSRTKAGRDQPISYPDYKYLREHDRAHVGLAASSVTLTSVGLGDRSRRVMAEFVSGNYFEALGVTAQIGRTFGAIDEITPGGHPVAVIGNGLWRRQFGGDPAIVGKTIHVNTHPLTVVGVADARFHGTIVSWDIEVFIPLMMATEIGLRFGPGGDPLASASVPWLMVLGRRQSGVSGTTAASQLSRLSTDVATEWPVEEVSERFRRIPIWQSPFGAQTYLLPAVAVLGAMGAVLLLIVCANVAGLVLARGISRRGEVALRLALGASRGRVLRLLFIESALLAVPGAAASLLLVCYALPYVSASMATVAPIRLFYNLSTDQWVIGFAVLASCVTAIGFGLVPAWRSTQVDLAKVMKDDLSPRGSTRGRFRTVLVIGQVSASLFLLVSAGLVNRSLEAARRADTGFDANQVISLTVDLRPSGYDDARGRLFYEAVLDRARNDRMVESATLAAWYPMSLVEPPGQKADVEGYQPRRDEDLTTFSNVVAPDYFHTLRIPIEAGREFSANDNRSALPAVVVNHTLATRFWGGPAAAIGKRLRLASGKEWRTVVGVARDVKYARIDESPRLYVYLPFTQVYQSSMMLHTRSPLTAAAALDSARGYIRAMDSDVPIVEAKSLVEQTTAALTVFQMTAGMLLIFGTAAMALAAMGLYGLVSYTVKLSTHEIGIRIALGAGRLHVVWRFLLRGLRLGVIGAACGLVASVVVTRLLSSVLFGVSAIDPISFATAALVVVLSVALASLVPAWRAARTNPMTALRHH